MHKIFKRQSQKSTQYCQVWSTRIRKLNQSFPSSESNSKTSRKHNNIISSLQVTTNLFSRQKPLKLIGKLKVIPLKIIETIIRNYTSRTAHRDGWHGSEGSTIDIEATKSSVIEVAEVASLKENSRERTFSKVTRLFSFPLIVTNDFNFPSIKTSTWNFLSTKSWSTMVKITIQHLNRRVIPSTLAHTSEPKTTCPFPRFSETSHRAEKKNSNLRPSSSNKSSATLLLALGSKKFGESSLLDLPSGFSKDKCTSIEYKLFKNGGFRP